MAFLIISATFVSVAVANAKKTREKRLHEAAQNSSPASTDEVSGTDSNYSSLKKRAAEMRMRKQAAGLQDSSESRDISNDGAENASPLSESMRSDGKPLTFNPEEMIIYSEIMTPKYEEY